MVNALAVTLAALIVLLSSLVALGNLVYRRRRRRKSAPSLRDLELLKEQGMITEEEFESLKNGVDRPQEPSIESCTISAEEMMQGIDAALKSVSELERDNAYTGNQKWAEVFGIQSPLNLSLKELTLLSMEVARPREAVTLTAEVLAMNVSIDAIEIAQSKGKIGSPNYKAIARMIWVRTRSQLSESISTRKEIHGQRKTSDQALLAELVPMIMRAFHIPTTASGFAVILALIIAKMEFNAFSEENEEDSS